MKASKTENKSRHPDLSDADPLFVATVNKMLRTPPKAHDDIKATEKTSVSRKKEHPEKASGDE